MNDKFGTTKLLTVRRDASVAAASVPSDMIAVRFGDRSTGIAMVDTSDAERLLIFQVTYADGDSHRAEGVNFLAGGEDKDRIRRVFVNRIVSEFVDRLPDLADRTRTVNYAQMVPRSAQLLFDLGESFEQFLYQEGSQPSCSQLSGICALIDSSDVSTSITTVDRSQQGQPVKTKSAPDSIHRILRETRQSLATLLADDLSENDSTDYQLTGLLHNMPLSERTEAFQRTFASCVHPALEAYNALVSSDQLCQAPNACGTIIICDPIFSSEFCRVTFARDFTAASPAAHRAISFVRDPGLLGFLGALLSA